MAGAGLLVLAYRQLAADVPVAAPAAGAAAPVAVAAAPTVPPGAENGDSPLYPAAGASRVIATDDPALRGNAPGGVFGLLTVGADSPGSPPRVISAAESMAHAREHGDHRAPPIDPTPDRTELPTAWELDDPDRYRDYENRQTQRLYTDYLQAADSELPRWQASLDQARRAGVPVEQIAEGEEKIRRLTQVRAQLEAAGRNAGGRASASTQPAGSRAGG